MHDLRVGFARNHGLPDDLADQIKGETIEELEANALALRKALEIKAESNPNQAELAAFGQDKAESAKQLLESLHGERPEPLRAEGPPNFDGGVRESVPLPSNPETDHNALILQMFREYPGGSGVDFWAMGGPPAQSGPAPERNPNQEEGDWRKGGT